MAEQHPITPPPELIRQWTEEHQAIVDGSVYVDEYIATQAARWGADQQLNADCEWMQSHFHGMSQWSEELRAAMRPKPPSLAEPALKAFCSMQIEPCVINGINLNADLMSKYDTIRRALERLQELENNG